MVAKEATTLQSPLPFLYVDKTRFTHLILYNSTPVPRQCKLPCTTINYCFFLICHDQRNPLISLRSVLLVINIPICFLPFL
jgi:hypothetical protein